MAALPWVAAIIGLAARQVEPQLEEAALLDAPAWHVFWHVTLPITPAIGLAALWVALLVATDMTVTDLYQVRTYAEEVYTEFAAPDISAPPLGPWAGAIIIGPCRRCDCPVHQRRTYSARLLPKQTHEFH